MTFRVLMRRLRQSMAPLVGLTVLLGCGNDTLVTRPPDAELVDASDEPVGVVGESLDTMSEPGEVLKPVSFRILAQGNPQEGGQFITIQWDVPDGVLLTQVERDGEIVKPDDDNDTYRDPGDFVQGQEVIYRLRSADGDLFSDWSDAFTVVFDCELDRCPPE